MNSFIAIKLCNTLTSKILVHYSLTRTHEAPGKSISLILSDFFSAESFTGPRKSVPLSKSPGYRTNQECTVYKVEQSYIKQRQDICFGIINYITKINIHCCKNTLT